MTRTTYFQYFGTLILLILLNTQMLSQEIWVGSSISFTKPNGSDWTLPVNQDSLSPSVILTRANNKGIFNIESEIKYSNFSSPAGTQWALGSITDINNLAFSDWETTFSSSMPPLNQSLVLYLVAEDAYVDIIFSSWAGGMNGGFSYSRSTGTATISVPLPQTIPTLSEWGLIVLSLFLIIIGIVQLNSFPMRRNVTKP